MHYLPKNVFSVRAVLGLFLLPTALLAATGEVTKSGSTWTGKVDGVTRYTGTQMTHAVNACGANMSSGWINIRAGGNASPDYGIGGKNGVWMNFANNSFNGNGAVALMTLDKKDNIHVDNLRITGNPRYATWFRTSSNMHIWNNNFNQTGGLGIRIDDQKGGWGRSTNIYTAIVDGRTAQAIETYGIDGFQYDNTYTSDSTGCGVLLNKTLNSRGTSVNAWRCCYGGGYAGFRNANANGQGTLGTVNSYSCGRGYFSVTGSYQMVINKVNASNCSGIGIWLQDTWDTKVWSGTLRANSSCWSITGGGRNEVHVSCQ